MLGITGGNAMTDPFRVRKPAVAGSFYPDDPDRLNNDIRSFLENVPKHTSRNKPLVLIEPHAGYVYSGQVAAYGYKLLQNTEIRTVAVISPSHMESFPFVSVFDGDSYETPLGRIDVDHELAEAIASTAPDSIKLSSNGHILPGTSRQEHALEVQLPFLQHVLSDFSIVPIVMGDQSWEFCAALGAALTPHFERHDFLVVVSSDLSHFHEYESANKMDGTFCRLMADMNPRELYDSIRKHESEACGAGPVIASLIAAREAGADECVILNAANSGDITGDRGSVVGYASAVVRRGGAHAEEEAEETSENEALLSASEEKYLIALARHAIAETAGVDVDKPEPLDTPGLMDTKGAFVTIKIGGRLRGCIGMIESLQPLTETIGDMARAAATSDPRFPAISEDEYPRVEIEISVLSRPHATASWEEIIVGRDGIIVEKGLSRGLLLPQVAVEAGWDAKTFLEFTCEKAGLPPGAWRDEDTEILTFSAHVFGETETKGL